MLKKLSIAALGVMMFAVVAVPAQAQTVPTIESLTAQIAALMAQVQALQGTTATTPAAPASLPSTQNLTIGSRGADVVALQTWLESTGDLVMPAGVAKGYFGTITQSALQKWQARYGVVPASGYYGPITRAKIQEVLGSTPSTGTGTTPTNCPAGFTCTPSSGSTGNTITTPGVEGILTVSTNPTPSAGKTVREGDMKTGILGIKLEAKLSDINVQRVKIDLGTSASIYTKVFNKLYLLDGSNVIAEVDLNSSNVVRESSNYFVYMTGFDFVVPKDSTKVLTVAADLYNSIKVADQGSKTVTVPVDGVRGVDGAGVEQRGPSTGNAISRNVNVSGTLVDSASLKLSTNSNSPKAQNVIASDGSNDDELDGLTVLAFDLKAEKDAVEVIDLEVTVSHGGSGSASATVAYLFVDGNEIGSASVDTNTGVATFTDVEYVISKDTTKTFQVRVDIRDANSSSADISASVTNIVAENSEGSSVSYSGSANGQTMAVRNAGIEVSLASITMGNPNTVTNSDVSTTSRSITFNVRIKALGDGIIFGDQTASSSTFGIATYVNDASMPLNVASSTSFAVTEGGDVIKSGLASGQNFKLNEGGEITVPVTFTFVNRNVNGSLLDISSSYKAALDNIIWATETTPNSTQTTNFMSGRTEWRSASAF